MQLILPKGDRTEALLRLSVLFNQLDRAKAWWWTEAAQARAPDAQNQALFGVAYKVLSDETGYTKDELHEAFCRKFFGTRESIVFGVPVRSPQRTTTRDENGKRGRAAVGQLLRLLHAC